MKYLIDANIWLEAVTGGPRESDIVEMLTRAAPGMIATTDFTVHTVGLVLTPRNPDQFRTFLDDLIRHRVFTLHLSPADLYAVADCIRDRQLDFDDAFQYLNAERHDLRIVNFDSDFDRTPRGRITPAQAVAELNA